MPDEELPEMSVLVIYDDGRRQMVEADTWLEVVRKIGCTALSLTVVADNNYQPFVNVEIHEEWSDS